MPYSSNIKGEKAMSSVILKETKNISLITLAFVTIDIIVIWALGYFGVATLLGTLLGWAVSVINFFLMGLILHFSLSNKAAPALMGFGYILRLALIALALIWAIKVDYLNHICVVIPLVFPQIAIFILSHIRKDKCEDERT